MKNESPKKNAPGKETVKTDFSKKESPKKETVKPDPPKKPRADAKKPEKKSSGKKRGASQSLGAMDIVVAALFIGGLIFAVAAFSNSVHPMKDSFIYWPLALGGGIGLVAGFIVWKVTHFESVIFMMVVMLLGGASIAAGIVLAFNRPLDRSRGEIRNLQVVYKYAIGAEPDQEYYVEVDDAEKFPVKKIRVQKDVYQAIPPLDQPGDHRVAVQVRPGFFGFPYIERTLSPGMIPDKPAPPVPAK